MAKDPLAQYEGWSEARNLAERLGQTGVSSKFDKKLNRWAKRHGDMDTSGLDIEDFEDWRDLAPGTADAAMKPLVRLKKKGLKKRGAKDLGRAITRYKSNLSDSMEGLMRRGAEEEYDPVLEGLQNTAAENVNEAAISAQEEAAIRSRLAAQVRTAQSENLNMVGAALGLGNMENSPAAAALASRSAEDYDRALVSGLRDTSLKTEEINRTQQRADLDLATRIANTRWNMFNGDSASLINMRGSIADMVQALYSRNTAIDLQREALKDTEDDGGWMDDLSAGIDLAKGAFGLYTGVADSGLLEGLFGGGEAAAG